MISRRLRYVDRVRAGASADRVYHARYASWRRRTRVGVLIAMVPVPLLMLVGSFVWPAHRSLYLGIAVGSSLTLPFILSLAVPEHIDRWRRGAEAEKCTAKELRKLSRRGWTILHDLPDSGRGNRDHVAVSPSSAVFLLDSKAPGGLVDINRGVMHVQWLDAPDDGYRSNLTPRMKAAAARLANGLQGILHDRPAVTPVVVIWGRWSGSPHQHDGVAWVHGKVLAERLIAHEGDPDPGRHASVVKSLATVATPQPSAGTQLSTDRPIA